MKKLTLALVFALTICSSNALAYKTVIDAAHEAGFTHCDTAIKAELEAFMKAGDSRYNISWIPDARMFTITGTYGSANDTVFISVTFVDTGDAVYGSSMSSTTFPGTAVEFMDKYKAWNYVATQGGTTWTANKGGVICIITSLPGGGVSAQYMRDFKYVRD